MNKKSYRILLMISILLLGIRPVFSIDAIELYNKILDKFDSLHSISMEFNLRGSSDLSGELKAVKGNKYVLKISERIITCNGKTVWNYSVKDNNVVISDFDPTNLEFSIEQFFFNILASYSPDKLTKVSSSDSEGGAKYLLTMLPEEGAKIIGGVTHIKLWIDPKTNSILSVGVETSTGYQLWDLYNIRINPKLKSNLFSFKKPKNAEVIDLR